MAELLLKQHPIKHNLIFRRRLFFFIIKLIPIPTLRKRLRNSPFLSRNKQKFLKDFNFEKRIIYQKSIQTYKAPDLTEARNCGLEKEFSQNFFDSIEHIPEYAVHKIPNGFVFGEEGYILTENRTLLRDYTAQKYHPKRSLHPAGEKDLSKLKKIHIEGNVAVIASEASQSNYFHFMIEELPRLDLLNKSGYKIDKIYANGSCEYQKRIFELLGLADKIIAASLDIIVSANNIIAPDILNNFRNFRTEKFEQACPKYISRFICEFYQKTFLPFADKNSNAKRIYISRGKTAWRKVLNENEVIEFLINEGFKILIPEELPLAEQVGYFSNAELIVAPHGSGLVNLLYCKPKTKVIELLSSGYMTTYFNTLSQAIGLHYDYLICDAVTTDLSIDPMYKDIVVDIEKLSYKSHLQNNITK